MDKSKKSLATLTAVHPPARFGELKLSGNVVKSFQEKPQLQDGWINGVRHDSGIVFLENRANKLVVNKSNKNDVIVWHAAMLPFAGLWSDGRTQNHRAIAVFEPLTGEMVKTDMSIRPIEGGRLLEVVCVSTLREFLAIYERDGKTYRLKMVDYRRDPFLKGGGKYVVVEPAIHAVDS